MSSENFCMEAHLDFYLVALAANFTALYARGIGYQGPLLVLGYVLPFVRCLSNFRPLNLQH